MKDLDFNDLFEGLPVSADPSVGLMRCECGALVFMVRPKYCSCGKALAYWRTLDRHMLKLEDMDLGHLSNTVRFMAESMPKAPSSVVREFEDAIDIFYAEIASREKEIVQVTGIMAALTRSISGQKP